MLKLETSNPTLRAYLESQFFDHNGFINLNGTVFRVNNLTKQSNGMLENESVIVECIDCIGSMPPKPVPRSYKYTPVDDIKVLAQAALDGTLYAYDNHMLPRDESVTQVTSWCQVSAIFEDSNQSFCVRTEIDEKAEFIEWCLLQTGPMGATYILGKLYDAGLRKPE